MSDTMMVVDGFSEAELLLWELEPWIYDPYRNVQFTRTLELTITSVGKVRVVLFEVARSDGRPGVRIRGKFEIPGSPKTEPLRGKIFRGNYNPQSRHGGIVLE